MSDLRKAAEMALEALEDKPTLLADWLDNLRNAREALRQALAYPPCQTGSQCIGGKCPECEWVGLTDDEFYEATKIPRNSSLPMHMLKAIEAKLKEKNGG